MKRLLAVSFPLLLCLAAAAQQAAEPTTAQLSGQIASLRVARTLKLRADQVAQLRPLLQQVAEARARRLARLDELWGKYEQSLRQVDGALVAGQQAPKAAVAAAEEADKTYHAALDETDDAIAAIVDKVAALLDREQAKAVESAQQQRNRLRNAERLGGAADLAEHIATYAIAMRELSAEDYDGLRGAVGMRLAGLLVPPADRRFNNAVADVLRVLDTVRRMADADFARNSAQLPEAVGRALGLQAAAGGSRFPVTYDDFFDFVAREQTPAALDLFQPFPPLEVNQ